MQPRPQSWRGLRGRRRSGPGERRWWGGRRRGRGRPRGRRAAAARKPAAKVVTIMSSPTRNLGIEAQERRSLWLAKVACGLPRDRRARSPVRNVLRRMQPRCQRYRGSSPRPCPPRWPRPPPRPQRPSGRSGSRGRSTRPAPATCGSRRWKGCAAGTRTCTPPAGARSPKPPGQW